MFKTYLLYSGSKNRFNVAHTADKEDRIKRHNSGKSKSTKYGFILKIVCTKEFSNKSEAYQFERHIKKQKSCKFNKKLINDSNG
ncbi:GIY-YIG nuclease family protein [Winogradskyella forsetii]|uniref:GIY-YIG nuclease family protein n=1 Tax=Winogradskyella forsetii TaxID=2686077 RepID=UPI0015C19330